MLRGFALVTLLSALGCAKSSSVTQCPAEVWQGECELASVTKVEDKEFPIPHVVVEALYRPLPNRRYPEYTPGALAQRTMVKSELELPLYDHLQAYARVACTAQPPPNGTCTAPAVSVAVPAFDAAAAQQKLATSTVSGCAQIEASAAQDAVRQYRQAHTVVSQRIPFGESSAALPPEAEGVASELATLLRAQPGIECLGIVGQIAAGESPGLADQRAKAVRQLLSAHGIDAARLLTISATAKVFGSGSRPAEADPADRRVGFSVLLERAP